MATINPRDWPEHQTENLKVYWEQGFSAAQIVIKLGEPWKTRSAVIGKVHRLKLNFAPRQLTAPKRKRKLVRKRERPTRKFRTETRIPALVNGAALEQAFEAASVDTVVAPVMRLLTLMQLEDGDCHWPAYGHYCGNPVDGRSRYCLHHLRMAHGRSPIGVEDEFPA